MTDLATGSVGRQIESLFDGSSVAGLTDRQLLERFTSRRDAAAEVAFSALVSRHGPMVLGICRQVLADRHHAEDAFQAVFLVLARKARSIRNPDLLGTWLYGVALRTAQKANARLSRQRKNEGGEAMSGPGAVSVVEPMVPPADLSASAREQAEILHEEIAMLPRSFRLPIILCYLEGLTLAEAASRLEWPAGTLHSRLARAREKLRHRIVRRGLSAPAALPVGLSLRFSSAFVSRALCDSTTRAAIHFAAGQSASSVAASLAREVIRATFADRLRLIATSVLVIAAGATVAGYFASSVASQHEPKRQSDAPRPQVVARSDDTNLKPAPGRMFVTGRVLGPEGKPVPNAVTMVYAAIKQPGRVDGHANMTPSAIGQARSDGSGLFQIDAPRTMSSRHHQTGMVALAPGYGAGWVELDPDADRPNIDITLRPEQVIQGRFFDVNGLPAQGVTVMVQTMGRLVPADLPNHRKESIDGPSFWWNTAKSLPAWPAPAVSDVDGRFTIRGAGRDLRVIVAVDDPQFARQQVSIDTDGTPQSKPLKIALEPAKIIKGRIIDAGTGKPIPHAPVRIVSQTGGASGINEFQADAEGRFRANPLSADRFYVSASAPEGRFNLIVEKRFDWPKGAVEHSMDFALPRGVSIHGKVTEEGSGRPLAGARIRVSARLFDKSGTSNGQAASDADGSYRLAALPGPGYLTVLGPSDDYVLQDESGDRILSEGASAGGIRYYAHAIIACDPKATDQSVEINVTLRQGATVSGRVVGPEGQSVHDAWMFGRFFLHPSHGAWMIWSARDHGSVASGRFTIHGVDPDAEVPVYFLDPHHRLGATVSISGKSASRAPVIVQLAPCGAAKARLIDVTGKPMVGYRASSKIMMVVTPGVLGAGDRATINGVDAINYANGPISDDQGRVIFPALIPGAFYRVTPRTPIEASPVADFSVKPGETIDLGDIVVQKPRVGK